MTTTSPPTTTKPRRRWLQFSLWTLMVLVVLVSVPLGWLEMNVRQARIRREAVSKIQELGGTVYYDYDRDIDPRPSGLKWAWDLLGHDFFLDVDSIDVQDRPVTDVELVRLQPLTHLRYLDLTNTHVTDAGLEHIKGLRQIERLKVGSTRITDAGLEHLRALSRLYELHLNGTQVTDEGVAELQKALPNLTVYR